MSEPKEFAAIAPMAGGSKVNAVSKIKNLPIWAFHGKIDKKVPYERSKSLMDKLKTSKVAKLTTFEDEGHGIVMQVLRIQNFMIGYPNKVSKTKILVPHRKRHHALL